jgi:hypothetical protein
LSDGAVAFGERRRVQTKEQRLGLMAAVRRSMRLRRAGELDERFGEKLVASLGPNEGFLTPSSSPHLFFLAACLEGKIR